MVLTAKVDHLLVRTRHELNIHDLPGAGGIGGPLDPALTALIEDRGGGGLERDGVCTNRRELEQGERGEQGWVSTEEVRCKRDYN